jgi:hypothetical protein
MIWKAEHMAMLIADYSIWGLIIGSGAFIVGALSCVAVGVVR